MQDRPLSLPHVFRRAERYFGHKSVVSGRLDGEVTMTWAEVCARVRRLAAARDELGVPAGARVGTFAWNSHRHVELYLAVPCTGRVLHTVNHRLFGEQISYIVNDAEDDVLFVVGRRRDMIKCGGFQVWPSELEEVLLRHARVAEVAVVGAPDERMGEIPVAFVVAREPDQALADELMSLCRSELAAYKAVRKVVFVDELPRSGAGKVKRAELLESFVA
jgi:acyl-CoA synthetase (AMP-forming)/AMP-acid ligase II